MLREVLLEPEHRADLRELGRLLAVYKKRIAIVAGTMLLSVLMQLPLPFLTMLVIDRFMESKDLSLFPLICVGLLFFVIAASFVRLVHGLVLALLREHILGHLQLELVDRLQACPISYFYTQRSGYLSTRLRTDLNSLSSILAGPLLAAVQNVLLLVGASASMLFLSWKLSAFCLAVLPLFGLTIVAFNRSLRARSRQTQEANARFGSTLQESIAAMPLIKALGAESRERRRVESRLVRLVEAIVKQEVTASLASRLIHITGTIGPLGLLWFGASEYLAGSLTIGQFVAFHSFLGFLFAPVQGLLTMNIRVQSALVSLRRLMEIRNLPAESATSNACKPVPESTELRAESIWFGYRADQPVLRGLDLTIPAGEKLALVGPSGEGKTSLMRLLLRFHDPDQGRVLLGGTDLRNLDLAVYRSRLAVVFQEPYLLSGTIEANLRLACPNASWAEMQEACELACAHEFIAQLPDRYLTPLGEGAVTLSAGQKMRLAIARALLRKAPILLMDEPTSALDETTAARVLSHLRTFLAHRTALIITHQQAPVMLADRVCSLSDGASGRLCSPAAYIASTEHQAIA